MGYNIHVKTEAAAIDFNGRHFVILYHTSIDSNLYPRTPSTCAMGSGSVAKCIQHLKSTASMIPGMSLQKTSVTAFLKEGVEALRNPRVIETFPEWIIQKSKMRSDLSDSYWHKKAFEALKLEQPAFVADYLADKPIQITPNDYDLISSLASHYAAWNFLPYWLSSNPAGMVQPMPNSYQEEVVNLVERDNQQMSEFQGVTIGETEVVGFRGDLFTKDGLVKLDYRFEAEFIKNHPSTNPTKILSDWRKMRAWLKSAQAATGVVLASGETVSLDQFRNPSEIPAGSRLSFDAPEWLDWHESKHLVKKGGRIVCKNPVKFEGYTSKEFVKDAPRRGMKNVWWSVEGKEYVRINGGIGQFKMV
jgi:major membrane immunogen (membrane-anchored lipoprotein)